MGLGLTSYPDYNTRVPGGIPNIDVTALAITAATRSIEVQLSQSNKLERMMVLFLAINHRSTAPSGATLHTTATIQAIRRSFLQMG